MQRDFATPDPRAVRTDDPESSVAPSAREEEHISFGSLPTEVVRLEDPIELLLEEVTEEPETEVAPMQIGRGLRGRVAIVTGGATGIGRAIAL